jgi:glutaredoxin-like YruB-family protein
MKQVLSLKQFQDELKTSGSVWLLLVKSGSEQSECAQKNFSDAVAHLSGHHFFVADVNEVRDIHPEYNINSVPSLIEFRDGQLINVIKGCHQPAQFKAIFENAIFVSKNQEEGKPVRNVIVYTTPTCSWCTTLKRHLDIHQVRYREVDVSKDQKAAEAMVRKSGQQGVPQTEINGQIIVGFDRDRINRLLEIK